MLWQFWRQPGPRELSDPVRKALQSQLQVDSPGSGGLQFLSKSGHYALRRVKLIRIFDPARIEQALLARLKYADLDLTNHLGALRFDGHIETDGSVYLAAAS
jgi:hypothetical protein